MGDDSGIAHAPHPIALGDLVVTEDAEYRIVDYVLSPPGSPIHALVKVAPARLALAAS